MRILIDECLNWRLSRALTGHYAVSAQKMGWAGLKNSVLLIEAEKQFDVFITGDLNLNFQQDVTKYNIAVVVLHSESTQLQLRQDRPISVLSRPSVGFKRLPYSFSSQVEERESDIGFRAPAFRNNFPV